VTPKRLASTLAKSLKWWPAAAAFLIFLLLAQQFIPYPGLQNDEVLFAQPLYRQGTVVYQRDIAGVQAPLMLLDYLGALKSWVYQPIFEYWKPSPGAVRWPVTLICALTIGIFFQLVRFLHTSLAAGIGALLLATDSSYVLTGIFDWGPVCLQHFLLLSALTLAFRFHQTGKSWMLGAAAFCAGLGVWDKALFFWPLTGCAVAVAAVFPRELRRHFRLPLATLALAAFALGSLPLILFNVKEHGATFAANGRLTFNDIPQKIETLRLTSSGSVMMGLLIGEESADNPRNPETTQERWSASLHDAFGKHRENWMTWGLFAAFALFPLLWRTPARRPMLFALIAFAVGWIQMALTRNAGGSAHHIILLWPLPQLFVAVALAEVGRRFGRPGIWTATLAAAVLLVGNLLNLNQCFYQLTRFGAADSWTDATYALSASLAKLPPGAKLLVGDWGILNVLTVLNEGKLNIEAATNPFQSANATGQHRNDASTLFGQKDAIWLRFRTGHEMFTGINTREDTSAVEAGYRKVLLATFWDRNDRPILEAIRYEPVTPTPSVGLHR
jgi:hypothetical protein